MLIGKKIAVASVGVGCQTENQIADHHLRIARLAGDDMVHHGGPFDWILAGARSISDMIRADCYFPTDFDGQMIDKKPYWPRFSCHFWHEKTGNVPDFLAKRQHLAANWGEIRRSGRRIFIVSNTQNNILRALEGRPPIETRLFWDDICELSTSLSIKFGETELHVVTRDGLDDPIRPNRPPLGLRPLITIHKIGRDASQWAGNSKAWADLFAKIIP